MSTAVARRALIAALALCYLVLACVASRTDRIQRHAWEAGLGVVLPHDTFPSECSLCHVGEEWETLSDDFEFDHEQETGVPLPGAHERAQCLRCHNDRGPVADFVARGCAGCHEDVHQGQLGQDCERCHDQWTWNPYGQVELHDHTRFPLVGVHASTACRRCHIGAEVGKFTPTDVECVTCHRDDLAGANNPNHINVGFVDRCDRCHQPASWIPAESKP